jgi:hypothetical protein
VLNDITLLVIAVVMLRNPIFGRATAFAGLIAGLLMTVPASVILVLPLGWAFDVSSSSR